MPTDFEGAFSALRDILRRHAEGMVVLKDTPTDFTVTTRATGPNKKPIWFGAVTSKKSAVSYHLVPLYYNPRLQATVPAALLARQHGKTCFNFQRPEAALFAELDALTARGREQFAARGMLAEGRVTQEQMNAALRAAGANPERIARERAAKGKAAAAKRAKTMARKASRLRTRAAGR
jgi:hypothetical protein